MNKESVLSMFKVLPSEPSENDSIAKVISPEMGHQASGNILMDELQVYGGLYQQKMMEKTDRNEIVNAGRRAAKLFIIGGLTGGLVNRLFTKIKFGRFDFLNLALGPRIFIRLSLFVFSFGAIFYLPMIHHLYKVRDNLNKKYTPRMKLYQMEMDPLIMNPHLLNEPGMNEDEREYMKVFYENMKGQAAMMKAQMKMMEDKEKREKKK